jgi:hypothetical protein
LLASVIAVVLAYDIAVSKIVASELLALLFQVHRGRTNAAYVTYPR